MMDAAVIGVVLAGGRSRRFGEEKTRHPVDGQPMVGRVVDVMSTICPTVLVSVGADPSSYRLSNVRYVQDHFSDAGPLAGIHAAMLASDSPWLLVSACDLPYLTPEVLRGLLAGRAKNLRAVVARDAGGRLHPLCGCYHRDLRSHISTYLADRGRSVHGFISQIEYKAVAFEKDDPLANVNTRRDLLDRMSTGESDLPRHG